MRILIVNGYNPTERGRKAFKEFYHNVESIIKEESLKYGQALQIETSTRYELSDYLYDIAASYHQAESARNFDVLDMIFICGEVNLLPWMAEAQQMLSLVKMCIKVKKPLFASGFAMQAIVFLCATNIEKPINVVNGKEHGSSTTELKQMTLLSKPRVYDHFLDHITGDLYQYSNENDALMPVANAGLHYHRAACGFNTLGKFVIKTTIYSPIKSNLRKNELVQEGTETTCLIKKFLLSYWLFEDCEMEFVVPTKAQWEIHPFNFTNKDRVFKVLAESPRAPLIIEMTNIVGVKFDIDHRYSNTIKILTNFIRNKLKELLNHYKQLKRSILHIHDDVQEGLKNSIIFDKSSGNSLLNNSKKFLIKSVSNKHIASTNAHNNKMDNEEPKIEEEKLITGPFKHVGFSSTNHGLLLVDKNHIVNKSIKVSSSPLKPSRPNILSSYDINKRPKIPLITSANNTATTNTVTTIYDDNNTNTTNDHGTAILRTENSKTNFEIIKSSDIRKLLYPNLEEELLNVRDVWVPGNYSNTIRNQKIIYKNNEFNNKQNKKEIEIKVADDKSDQSNTQAKLGKKDKLKEVLTLPPDYQYQYGFKKSVNIRIPYKIQYGVQTNQNSKSQDVIVIPVMHSNFVETQFPRPSLKRLVDKSPELSPKKSAMTAIPSRKRVKFYNDF